jgi:uncharacterized membrane protein
VPVPGDLLKTEGLGSYFIASILFAIGLYIGLILCIVPGIIWAVVFHFFGYVCVENPGISPVDALKRSAEITKGQRGTLFGLLVVCLLINVLGAILCGVGLLVSIPVTFVASAYAYRTLSGQSISAIA